MVLEIHEGRIVFVVFDKEGVMVVVGDMRKLSHVGSFQPVIGAVVKGLGEKRHIGRPKVPKRNVGSPLFLGRNKVTVGKGVSVERQNGLPGDGFDRKDDFVVGNDVKLGKIVEDGEEVDVENEDSLVYRDSAEKT